eukprot:TRINITY_DN1319_c0_g2_i1.p1 TRINITY_DN1319_c0_g2~~TRINITY_DN1319_c0_g2_i1.p1  ORF type:complete len:204 (+),score=62.17 TRINITY_DN1319_c0_g2_i1:40-651(+)
MTDDSVTKKYKWLKKEYVNLQNELRELRSENQSLKDQNTVLMVEKNFLIDRLIALEPTPDVIDPNTKRKRKVIDDENRCIFKTDSGRCSTRVHGNLKYCWHHAPMDPESGFVYCNYVDSSKSTVKQCQNPVHKDQPIKICPYHVKHIQKILTKENKTKLTDEQLAAIDWSKPFDLMNLEENVSVLTNNNDVSVETKQEISMEQ